MTGRETTHAGGGEEAIASMALLPGRSSQVCKRHGSVSNLHVPLATTVDSVTLIVDSG